MRSIPPLLGFIAFPDRPHRCRSGWWVARLTGGLLLSAPVWTVAAAQADYNVQITPAVIAVDPHTHTATVQFVNPSSQKIDVTLTVQYATPRRVAITPAIADSLRADLLATDSLARHWSLGQWLQEVPTHFTLDPHEQHAVTLHLRVPALRRVGTYSVFLVAKTLQVESEQQHGTGLSLLNDNDGPPNGPFDGSAAQIVYQVTASK